MTDDPIATSPEPEPAPAQALPVDARLTKKGWRVSAVIGDERVVGAAPTLDRALDQIRELADEAGVAPFLEPKFDLGELGDRVSEAYGLLRNERERLDREEKAWEVRRAAGPRDDGRQATRRRAIGVGEQIVGHAVRRDHTRFVRDTKLLENVCRVLHRVPV